MRAVLASIESAADRCCLGVEEDDADEITRSTDINYPECTWEAEENNQ